MKLAVTGKGGVGKTTLVAGLAKVWVEEGKKVFCIDADPDANLALTLGFPHPSEITPLVEMKDLIEERTGAKPGSFSPFFKLNPRVEDIPDKFFSQHKGVRLAVMGTVRGGGLGCTCPENAFLKALLRHLMVEREEVVILDMEAGIEHLGRGTAEAMDLLIVVVEPGRKSLETAIRIRKLALQIGIKRVEIVGNKVRDISDEKFIREALSEFKLLGFIPYDEKLIDADLKGLPLGEMRSSSWKEMEDIARQIDKEGQILLLQKRG